MNKFDISKHLFARCTTTQLIVKELSKLLRGTDYIITIPNGTNDEDVPANICYISASLGSKVDYPHDNKFIIFINGQFGVISTNDLNPDKNTTNFDIYGDKLLKSIDDKLDDFCKGRLAVKITYDNFSNECILKEMPIVELVFIDDLVIIME